MRWAYLAVADLISGGHHDIPAHADDVIVANSLWTANLLAQRHGLRSQVIYPPVYAPVYDADAARSNDFVMLGRISPEKRVIEAIDVLSRVRERGHQVGLHIIGPLDESAYSDQVRSRAQRQGDWVRLHGGLYGDEKFVELGHHAFGLHLRQREAFGIAVAEMIKMGLVPFVPAGGAPAEIVADERLVFQNQDHAVEVIDRVLRNQPQLASIKERQAERAKLFSTEKFVMEARKLVDSTLGNLPKRTSIGEGVDLRLRQRSRARTNRIPQVMSTNIRRVCIAHPGLGSGGSEACAMALLEAFQHEHETTLITGAPFDCARLNRAYHGHVDESRINVMIAPTPEVVRDASAGDAMRGAFFARFLKDVSKDFDICISSYNFAEFDRPAIQFVADFSWDDKIRRAYDPVSPGLRGFVQRPNPVRWAYLAAANLIRGGRHNIHAHADDVIVANSLWTANLLAQRHGLRSQVIYPPVYAPVYDADAARSNDFVMLGRISPEKRVIEAIDVLSRVRERGHQVGLHIIGPLDESAYSDQVRSRAQRQGDWVRLHGGLYGDEKFVELGHHAFGLHLRQREAFGIAVAEMIKMGLVPFVPAGGAPAEIVADERLVFQNQDHAVEVIDRVLRNQPQLASIKERQAERAKLFSTEKFVMEARKLVDSTLGNLPKRTSIGEGVDGCLT